MARVRAFQRDIQLLIDRRLSPEAQKKMIAKAAEGVLKDVQAQNAAVLGRVPPHEHWVDGREGAPFESIHLPSGNITIRFKLVNEVVDWLYQKIAENSPQMTGRYRRSHRLFADGVEVDSPDPTLQAQKWEIVSNVPYARKIERGQSAQSPDGVYEVLEAIGNQRFGNIAQIKFTWIGIVEGGMTGQYKDIAGKTRGEVRMINKEIRYPALKIWAR
ncbi:hypothetical protein ACUSIJ_24985 [Pseudochelatococcus sp. B33]